MEKLETKKSLEKTKATLIFVMLFMILTLPIAGKALSISNFAIYVLSLVVTLSFLLKKIQKLNRRINSLMQRH